MRSLTDIARATERITRENASTILTALGATGVVTTAYLAASAAHEAAGIISFEDFKRSQEGAEPEDPAERFRRTARMAAPLYVPAAISGAITIGCIIGANRLSSRRAAALTAAYSLSDKAFHEYRDKVEEMFGEGKAKKVNEEIAQDHIRKNPPRETLVIGSGNVLCCEMYTGRYFESSMEALKRAQNEINAKINRHDHATLADFHDEVGLPFTDNSWEVGWREELMDLEFSAVLTEDERPCIAFTYKHIHVL